MRSHHVAACILAFVTSRDRANAIVGDLAECTATGGGVWFWSAVLQSAISLLWYEIAGHPKRMGAVVIRGLALNFGLVALFGVLSFVLIFTGMTAFGATMNVPGDGSGSMNPVAWTFVTIVPTVIFPLIVGRALAHWSPGHELAACLAFSLLAAALDLVAAIAFGRDAGLSQAVWAVVRGAGQDLLFVLVGAMWGRHRNLLRNDARRPVA
jgi:hypothetical protein